MTTSSGERPAAPQPFEIAERRLVDLRIVRLRSSSPAAIWRGVAPPGPDLGALLIHVRGTSATRIDGIAERDSPGSIRILRAESVVEAAHADASDRLLLRIPLAAVSAGSGALLRRADGPVPRLEQSAIGHALMALSLSTFNTPVLEASAEAYVAERAIVALIDAVLAEAETAAVPSDGDGFNQQAFARALATIDRAYGDLDLSAESIAERSGMSLRSLQRIFAENGETVSTAIRNRRLEAIAEALAAPEVRELAELTRDCGFTVADSARRAFHARYGRTMSEYRRERLAQS